MKQAQQKMSHNCEDNLHFVRLQALQGREDDVIAKTIRKSHPSFPIKRIDDWFSFGQAQIIISLGFSMFVTSDFVRKFNYAAMFNWNREQQVVGGGEYERLSISKGVYYSGDVPDYILDRIETIRGLRFSRPWAFVVLSKYALPVKTASIRLPTKDPIMIAFPSSNNAHPLQIFVDEKGKIVKNKDGRKIVRSWVFYDKVAFVVGSWGNKQEYE